MFCLRQRECEEGRWTASGLVSYSGHFDTIKVLLGAGKNIHMSAIATSSLNLAPAMLNVGT